MMTLRFACSSTIRGYSRSCSCSFLKNYALRQQEVVLQDRSSVLASFCFTPYLNEKGFSSSSSSMMNNNSNDIDRNPNKNRDNLLVVSILGPPNAGKSTLFNRFMCKESNKAYKLTSDKKRHRFSNKKKSHFAKSQIIMNELKQRKSTKKVLSVTGGAIVTPVAGTTRDRRECVGRIGDLYFNLIDTAGIDRERIDHLDSNRKTKMKKDISIVPKDSKMMRNEKAIGSNTKTDVSQSHTKEIIEKNMHSAMMEQTLVAIKDSDLILLMFDARIGITSDLNITAKWLRKLLSSSSSKTNTRTSRQDSEKDNTDANQSNQPSPQQRKHKRRVLLLANKLEGDTWKFSNDYELSSKSSMVMDNLLEATRIGFGDAIPVSAEHGEGMADIADVILEMTEEKKKKKQEMIEQASSFDEVKGDKDEDDEEAAAAEINGTVSQDQPTQDQREGKDESEDINTNEKNDNPSSFVEKPIQLAILGRQNVGKSTLVNALLKHDRVITGPMPGLTRDAISVEWSWRSNTNHNESEKEYGADQKMDDAALTTADRSYKDYPIKLVDTAGIRKLSQRDTSNIVENMALLDTMRAMKIADVAVLVVDALAYRLRRQELAIIDAIIQEGRPLIIAANKMDLIVTDEKYTINDTNLITNAAAVNNSIPATSTTDTNNNTDEYFDVDHFIEDESVYYKDNNYFDGDDDDELIDIEKNSPYSYTKEEFVEGVRTQVEGRIPMLRNIPIVAMSSLIGDGVEDLMPLVIQTKERWERTISTGILNRWLQDVLMQHPPPLIKRKGAKKKSPVKIKYIIQKKAKPPTFILFTNSKDIPDSYMRYLTRHFQDAFEMYGMEVRMIFKHSSTTETNPFHKKQKRGGFGLGGAEARKKRFVERVKNMESPDNTKKRKRRNR